MAEHICRLFAPEASLPSGIAAPAKPTIVIVPDACHVPAHYSSLAASLQQASYGVVSLALPSVSPTPPSNAFEADVQQVRSSVIVELEDGCDVVLVFHGYGGLPGCAALKGINSIPSMRGRVVRIVAYASWLVPEEHTLQQELGTDMSRLFYVQDDLVRYRAAEEICYNGVPPSVRRTALALLSPQGLDTFTAPARYEAWCDFPITYIFCDKDAVLSPRHREIQPGSLDPRVRRMPHGHEAHAVVPAWVAAVIREAAGEQLLHDS